MSTGAPDPLIHDPQRLRVIATLATLPNGGALGTLLGLRPTLWIAAAGGIAGTLLLLPSPLPRFRMPAGPAQAAERARPAT